jgi:hypothetical protein
VTRGNDRGSIPAVVDKMVGSDDDEVDDCVLTAVDGVVTMR